VFIARRTEGRFPGPPAFSVREEEVKRESEESLAEAMI